MTTRQRYSEELRAAALADVLLIGPGAAAAKYGIAIRTLFDWRQRYETADLLLVKKGRIGALVAVYLEANLQALTAQAYVASQPEYIERQPAESLAILHGVMADKSVRILEALDASSERAALESGGVHQLDTDRGRE